MKVRDWLLEGEPWVVYRTLLDLTGQSEDAPEVQSAYKALTNHPQIQNLLDELLEWPGEPLNNHKKAGHPLHKLVFLSDLGLKPNHPQVSAIVEKVKANQSPEGPFQIVVNLPTHFGGSGKDEMSWMLCDAGSTLYALTNFGETEDPKILRAADHLASLCRDEGGWPCAATAELGKFKGPGKRDDPCPYANLLMIKALLPFGDRYTDEIQKGSETLIRLWQRRRETKPFLFAMGTGFEKLKAPLVWYDIVHVLDVLSQIPEARSQPEVQEMAQIIQNKADAEGRYQPESIWMDWKGWDFGQKREPSRWLTFLILRIRNRFE
ncbi:MAG: hypothetical protein H0S79_22710 [Anaerolineaceae bacterium]|nr:hypothetical protein [Anaerolineaceae bacterium]